MGNIVNLRTRLEALEQKRETLTDIATKAERDAAVCAYAETLKQMTDAELEAEEARALASVLPGPMQENQRAAIAAGFREVRGSDATPNPTPPRAA
ncbi:MAG: hypothetical protein AB7P20_11415 [Rhizobiaceae bacterium]